MAIRKSTRFSGLGFLAIVLILLAFSPSVKEANAGSIASVDPAGASADVIVDITGDGFDPVASNNRVIFTRAEVSAENAAITVSALNPEGLKRIGVPMPEGLPAGTARVKVVNMTSGEVIEGASIEVIGITLEDTAAEPGSSVNVRITGTPNARFVPGLTIAAFGSGIRVNSETVESRTSLVANITVARDAAPGARSIGLMTESQVAVLLRAFRVKEADLLPQHPPRLAVASAGDEQTAVDIADPSPDSSPDSSIDDIFAYTEDEAAGVKKVAYDHTEKKSENTQNTPVAVEASAMVSETAEAQLASAGIEISTNTTAETHVTNVASVAEAATPVKEMAQLPEPVKEAENKTEGAKEDSEAVKQETAPAPVAGTNSVIKVASATEQVVNIKELPQVTASVKEAEHSAEHSIAVGDGAKSQVADVNIVASSLTSANDRAVKPAGERPVEAKKAWPAPAKEDFLGKTAQVTVKDLPAPKTEVPAVSAARAEESGLLKKLFFALLAPFILLWYLISHMWK